MQTTKMSVDPLDDMLDPRVDYKSTSPKPAPAPSVGFLKAMEDVLIGKKAHKLEWKDKAFWVEITADDRLSIHKPDGMYYAWTIMRSDTLNNDWIIL